MPPNEIDPKRPLLEMGLDSRTTLVIRVHLEKHLGIKLPATLLWRHPTLNDVVMYLRHTQTSAQPA